jgi:hypothetical protein
MLSHDRETTEERRTKMGRRIITLQNNQHRQCARMLYYIIDPAHVENGSQATLLRKRFHHEFMYDLRNQRKGLASKYAVIHSGLRC